MRLLFITNFYPPAGFGGYELWCQEVAEGLRRKGHSVTVLTSNYQKTSLKSRDPDWLKRMLNLEMEFSEYTNVVRFFLKRKGEEAENAKILSCIFDQEKPQAVCVWGMWNLNRSLLKIIEDRMPGRMVYYMGDYWPFLPSQFEMYWNAPAKNPLTFLPKKILGYLARKMMEQDEPSPVKFEHVLFPSAYMQKDFLAKGFSPANSHIVYGGVELSEYLRINEKTAPGSPLSLLYVGRLEHEKGAHTAIEAAAILVDQYKFSDFTLKIVGSGERSYVHRLHQMVKAKNLEDRVVFLGSYPVEKMPEVYAQADLFLFTSIWQEPFGRVLIEAMAAGVVVVGTATGGAAEILLDEKTGLTYPAGNAELLAERIYYLASHPDRYKQLAAAARRFVQERFSTRRMVDEVEEYFLKTIGSMDL